MEYLNSNIYVTIDPTEEALGYVCERVSSKNLMLGTDYPHGDMTGRGNSDDHLDVMKRTHIDLILEREDLSDQAKEDISFRNALDFFGGHVA
jgi:predicted TIM-barrel fold metal-dependent hydrolase